MGSLWQKEGGRRNSGKPFFTAARAIPSGSQYPHFLDDTKLLKRYRTSTHQGSFPPQVLLRCRLRLLAGVRQFGRYGRAWAQVRKGLPVMLQAGTWKKDKVVNLLGEEDDHLLDEDVGPSPVEEYEPEQPTTTGVGPALPQGLAHLLWCHD
jgi:hypothetical protein